MLGAIPLLAASPLFAPLLLVPLLVAAWAWRSGTDVDTDGVVVRALLGQRRIPWSDVESLVPRQRRVHARLVGGSFITLPAVTSADMSRVLAAAGQPVTDSADPDTESAE
jgi:hypothetical protein